MTILELRTWARHTLHERGIASPQLDADLLLADALACTREMLLARAELPVPNDKAENFRRLVSRRTKGEPVAYLLGRKEFYGADFLVSPDVLIPRPETEILVEEALKRLTYLEPEAELQLIDVGTGSGAIALTLLRELKGRFAKIHAIAVDSSEAALKVAKKNAADFGFQNEISFVRSDLLGSIKDNLHKGTFALITANLPYIPNAERLSPEVEKFEPRSALRGGERGTELVSECIEQVLHEQPCSRGCGLFEIGYDQREYFEQSLAGRAECEFTPDLQGHPRVLRIMYAAKAC